MATNIYPRGTTQWWRRSVHFVAVLDDPITVRMSLKTRCPREARTRRGLSREQMDDIREILGKPKKERKPAGSRQKSTRFDIPPPTQSLWTALMDPIPGYTFKRRPADRGNPEEAAIVGAGLPPMTTLDGYKPGAAVELAGIATNREKAKFTWDTVATWLTVHAPADDATRFARRLAWTFLLGHVHGFLAEVKGLNDVKF